MKNLFFGPLFLGLSALILTGCASFPADRSVETAPTHAEQDWELHQNQLNLLTKWDLKGKAAVSSGKEGGTVNVLWHQKNTNSYHLEFYGLLGHGRTEITAKNGEIKLITREGPILVSKDVEVLLAEYTGWYLPVEHLFYWVRGLPAPEPIESLQLNSSGYVAELRQAGWAIIYNDYLITEKGFLLPRRLTLKHPGNLAHPALTIKWLSKEWDLK